MTIFALNLLLALAWTALTGQFTPGNLVLGFILAYVILYFARPVVGSPAYFRKAPRVLGLILFYAWELMLSNLRVAWDVISPRPRMKPGIVAIPLDARTDLEIVMLAHLITLTPGTISLDVSTDRKVLYIHAMYVDDVEAVRREIKSGLERRLLEVLR